VCIPLSKTTALQLICAAQNHDFYRETVCSYVQSNDREECPICTSQCLLYALVIFRGVTPITQTGLLNTRRLADASNYSIRSESTYRNVPDNDGGGYTQEV